MRSERFLVPLCLPFQIAMGQGQADLAIQTLRECAQNGEWLCLKNLHLVTSWLPVLEKVRVNREDDTGNQTKLVCNISEAFQLFSRWCLKLQFKNLLLQFSQSWIRWAAPDLSSFFLCVNALIFIQGRVFLPQWVVKCSS